MTHDERLPPVTVGDTEEYTFSFTDSGGNPYDLTGWTLSFTVKQNERDSDDEAAIRKDVSTHTNPTEGQTMVNLTSSDTEIDPGRYIYDFQVTTAAGNVQTLTKGMIRFTRGVTDRQ